MHGANVLIDKYGYKCAGLVDECKVAVVPSLGHVEVPEQVLKHALVQLDALFDSERTSQSDCVDDVIAKYSLCKGVYVYALLSKFGIGIYILHFIRQIKWQRKRELRVHWQHII